MDFKSIAVNLDVKLDEFFKYVLQTADRPHF